MNLTWNNNAYYFGTDAARQGVGQAGTTAGINFFTTLAALKAYSSTLSAGGTNDNASLAANTAVPFTSSTDLHLSSNSVAVANAGTAIAGVTTDFDGNTRSATFPDIGADEIASADLADLTLTAGALVPMFDPATTSYTIDVPNGTTSTTVTPTVLDSNATVTVNGDPVASGMASNPIALNVGPNNISVVVTPEFGPFSIDQVTAGTPKTYTVVVTRDAPPNFTLTYDAGPNGSISGTTPQTVPQGSDGTPVTAVPDTGYHFVNWSDSSTDNPRTDMNVQGDITVTANFAINTYTLTYLSGGNGSISGTTPQTVNYGEDGTAVTAVPNTGYHFVNWSDSSTANPRTDMNVMGDITVTANFAINTYTLTYTAGGNGSISGTSPQTVNYGENGSAVTAVPDMGYHFVNWSDSSTDNPRTDMNVMADVSVTANFAINTYTLTYSSGGNGSITGTSPQTVNYGENGTAVTAVPNTGYHFVNWSDASDGQSAHGHERDGGHQRNGKLRD